MPSRSMEVEIVFPSKYYSEKQALDRYSDLLPRKCGIHGAEYWPQIGFVWSRRQCHSVDHTVDVNMSTYDSPTV